MTRTDLQLMREVTNEWTKWTVIQYLQMSCHLSSSCLVVILPIPRFTCFMNRQILHRSGLPVAMLFLFSLWSTLPNCDDNEVLPTSFHSNLPVVTCSMVLIISYEMVDYFVDVLS